MKHLVLPVAAAAVLAFSGSALAACGGYKSEQTVEKPAEQPVENPST